MKTPTLTFFNNKGGVGKTSTLYNLSNMFAKMGKRVLAVDLDPQANLTSLCLEDENLSELWENEDPTKTGSQTIYHAVQQLIESIGDVQPIAPIPVMNTGDYFILAGDLRLSQFEDKLATEWNGVLGGKISGINVTSSFGRLIQQAATTHEIDIVFVDVGPNLGAINRAALIASDYVVVPVVPDLFSLQGLKNVGKYLVDWRGSWQNSLKMQGDTGMGDRYPKGNMQPIGYVILQHRERQSRLVAAHRNWAERIPEIYANHILLADQSNISLPDPNQIGLVRNYQSMMAMSHESRKPVFELKPADGAIGSHVRVVKEAEDTYRELAKTIAQQIGITFE